MTVTVSTLAPDAYGPAGAAIIGSGDPYKLYGYEAMKLLLDGTNAAGADKLALHGLAARLGPEPRQRARHLLARRQRRHDHPRLRPLRHQRQGAGLEGRDHRRVSSAIPSRVSVPDTVRSPSTSRHSPAGSVSVTGSPRSSTPATTASPRTNAIASGPAGSGW